MSNKTSGASHVKIRIKQRTKTRVFLGREAWVQHCKDYQASGLSQPDYAKKHGLVLTTFRNWIHRLQREEHEKKGQTFLPVKVNLAEVKAMPVEEGLKADIHITLPNGIQCSFTTQHKPNLIMPWIDYLRVLPA